MRKLSLLLMLIFASPVFAESKSAALRIPPNEKFFSHLESAQDLKNLEDYEGACLQMGFAIDILKTQLSEVQRADPGKNWHAIKEELQNIFDGAGCGPGDNKLSKHQRFVNQLEKAGGLKELGDIEKYCREILFAFVFLKYNRNDIQNEKPEIDFLSVMRDLGDHIYETCPRRED